jgi:DNA-binding NarL/FixJ family response regulator
MESGQWGPPTPSSQPKKPTGVLTTREHEVASLIADGLTNKQIGERVVISERTVDNHVQRILSKLGLERRVQVARYLTAPART